MEKYKESLFFLICIAVLVGLGFHFGIFNSQFGNNLSVSFNEFLNSFQTTQTDKKSSGSASSTRARAMYNGVRTSHIPQKVVNGVSASYQWNSIFKASKKTIFFVYDNNSALYSNQQFYNSVNSFLSSNNYNRYYQLVALDTNSYSSMKSAGDIGASKICDSIEECKAQADKASNHTAAATFVDRCAKNLCIVNPRKMDYIIVRNPNIKTTSEFIEKLKNW